MLTANQLYQELKDLKNVTAAIFDNDTVHFWVGKKQGQSVTSAQDVLGRLYLTEGLNSTFCISEFDDFLKYIKGVNEPIVYDEELGVVTTPNNEFEFVVDQLPPKDYWPLFPKLRDASRLYKGLNLKIDVPYDILEFTTDGVYACSFMGHRKRINKNQHELTVEVQRDVIDRLPRLTYDYTILPEYIYLQFREPLTNKVKMEFQVLVNANDLDLDDFDELE